MDCSDDDLIYNSSGEDNIYSDDDEDREYELAVEDIKRSQVSYVVLNEEEIRKQQRDDIERVSSVLSLTRVEAIALLLHYKWSVSKVEEEWFTDEDKLRKAVGILKEPLVNLSIGRGIECGICFESYRRKEILMVSCGHPYCETCWTGYITSKINDGPGCLMVKCPEPSCSAVVGQDLIEKVTTEEGKEKYYRFLFRSYIEDSGRKTKWCPSPGCEYAVDFEGGSRSASNYDVSCLCSYSFCMNCSEEAHSPVDCETVSKWIFKNNDESENTNWILANSKPCPECKRSIEKNQGCNHMTCYSPCKFQFCWICLASWKNHGKCNKLKGDEAADSKRKKAKNAIDRYIHYYERWVNNHNSRKKAMGDLEKLQSVQLKELSAKQGKPETELQFTVDAWLQIIECRRVLKWTYAYGYYLPQHEFAKKDFFEYLQGEAETGLERLHGCAELELKKFYQETENFDAFKSKLAGLTRVTKTYFENLVEAFENGLSDVGNSESKRQKLMGM